ncbi:MAG: FkbM family methyltransferase [Verrucomicrobiales bacterium]|nr:FkbM family methyltransferase [Verrucomicrobiales bacterium]
MNFIEKSHFLHRALRYRFRSEKFALKYVRRILREGDVCLDIGANRGLYTYWMSKYVGISGKVFAFEPQPEMQSELNDVIHAFSLKSVEVVPYALSDVTGTAQLRRPDNNWGGATLCEDRTITGKEVTMDVPLVRLEDVVQEKAITGVKLVKCDVEGHELGVFRGGESFLKEQKPALIFECDEGQEENCEVFNYLESIGYEGFFFHQGLAPIARLPQLLGEIHPKAEKDFIFIHRENVNGQL